MRYEVWLDGFCIRRTGVIDAYYEQMEVVNRFRIEYPAAEIWAVVKSKANEDKIEDDGKSNDI